MEELTLTLKTLNSATQILDLYTPKLGLDAEIIDFFITVSLPSIAEVPYIEKPNGFELMTASEVEAAWREATKDAPKKILSISYRNSSGATAIATEFVILHFAPSYTESLRGYLTEHELLRIPRGCTITAQIKDFGSGLLSGNDKIDFRITAREFDNPDIDSLAQKYL